MRNTGKTSEKLWEDHFRRLGKRAFFFRFVDAAEIRGRSGKVAASARAQPSDYMLTLDGVTEYAEVKSTTGKTTFPFSMLRSSQSAAAQQILAAGGTYTLYVHALELNQWFRIPYSLVAVAKGEGRSSLKWGELKPLEWTI